MADVSIVLKGVDQATGVIDGVGGALESLGATAGKLAAAGFAALAAGAAAVGAGLAYSVSQALEAEVNLTRLETVIKSTGGAAGLTTEMAQDLANKFMNLAGGSDDAVLAIQEMALRMGTVTAEQMPDFIQTTLDLAAATGVDAVNAARLLAQAQEDPISALTRFRRMGILFSEDLETQIKQMQDSGDTAGAMALVMDRLGEATGGAAAANAETLAGQWAVFTGNLSEAAETIGTAFMPVLHDLFDNIIAPAIPLIHLAAEALGEFFTGIMSGEDPIGDLANLFYTLANAIGLDGGGIFAAVIALREPFDQFISGLQSGGANAVAALQPMIDAAGNLLAAFIASLPAIQKYFADMVAFILAQVDILVPTLIANVSTMLDELAVFWSNHGETIMGVVNFAWRTIVVTIGGALTILSGLIAAALQVINGDWEGAWETIKDTAATFMNSVLSIVGTDLETFIATWTTNWEMAVLIVTTVWQQIADAVAAKIMEVTSGIQTAIINTIIWLREVIPTFIQIGKDIIGAITEGVLAAAGALLSAVSGAIAGALGLVGAVPVGSGAASSITNNSSVTSSNSTTNNFYGLGADMAAGYISAMAGAT